MIKMTDTVYDEKTDGPMPIVPGVYPAHVSGFDSRILQTKFGEQQVFNIDFQIAEEVDKVLPMLVHYDNDVPESVAYDKLSVLLLIEVKKLREEIKELKEKL